MAVSKRLRYEILRRDNHACRYCGAAAPEAQLTIDHVVPVALGGSDEPGNLVTACRDCNSGKTSSSPDAPVVADVSGDALRWGRAMAFAAEILRGELESRRDRRRQFLEAWNSWTYGRPPYEKNFPLDAAWEQSVDGFLEAGLPMDILLECVDLAMRGRHVQPANLFRYMCGIAWRKVRDMQEMASGMLEADPPDGAHSCGHVQPPGPCTLCAAGVPPRVDDTPTRGRHAREDPPF